jgi:hypothetical protein
MGAALYVVLERDIPGLDLGEPSRVLGQVEVHLRPLCNELGVEPLSRFLSDDPNSLTDLYEEEPEDDLVSTVAEIQPERFFDASQGLATVRALHQRLSEEPELIRGSESVVSELGQIEAVLEEADELDIRWHLAEIAAPRRSSGRSRRGARESDGDSDDYWDEY